jgi:hypothetical protein
MNSNIYGIVLYSILILLFVYISFDTWKFYFKESKVGRGWATIQIIGFITLIIFMGWRVMDLYNGLK